MTVSEKKIRMISAGDSALVLEFGTGISEQINRRIRLFVEELESEFNDGLLSGIVEWVPAFCSVSVYFDPLAITRNSICRKLKRIIKRTAVVDTTVSEPETGSEVLHTVPVCYEDDLAPDMATVCSHSGLSREQVIALHSSKEYLVYMLGFLPGFVYLGGMDGRLTTPRLNTPRLKIAAGSVGIAGSQTGIYPLDSPGGWQLIGRTPIKPYDPLRTPPVLFKAGDHIRFEPITRQDFDRLSGIFDRKQPEERILSPEGASVSVITAGALTTVQDGGRFRFQKDGFTPSGVMDRISYRLANAITGNKPEAAVLETTMLGPKLRFFEDTYFAVTGADQQPTLNGQRIPLYTQVYAHAGSILSLGFTVTGLRSYIAFSGGINVPVVLGSRSTSMRYGLGGFKGRALVTGDVLPLCTAAGINHTKPLPVPEELLTVPPGSVSDDRGPVTLRIIAGPQDSFFPAAAVRQFIKNDYIVSGESDRMGLRLAGAKLKSRNGTDIISDGITYGSVQISSSGQPIIMAADHQTCGGYAKIATVITADMPRLGQLKPGTGIRFKFVSYGTAVRELRRQKKILSEYIGKLQTFG